MASTSRTTLPLVVTLIFAACVSALLAAVGGVALNLDGARTSKGEVESARRLIHDIRLLRTSALEAEFALQDCLLRGNSASLDAYSLENKRRVALLGGLAQRHADNPVQLPRMEVLRDLTGRALARLDDALSAYKRDGRDAALGVALADPGGQKTMDGIRATTDAMIRQTERFLETRSEGAARRYWVTVATAMGANLIAILALAFFYSLTRRHFDRWIAAEEALQAHATDLESAVAARTRQLSQLSRHLIRVTENEKATLARELHDELGSNVTAVSLDVAAVEQKLKASEPALALRLRRALDALRSVVGLSRRVIEDLRPSALDNMTLAEALRGHCEEFTQRTGLPCEAQLGEDLGQIDPDWSIALFRVAQESLTNAARYAKATGVRLRLQREEKGLRLQVIDDGIGIAADALEQPLAHGLLGMRERVSMLGGTFGVRRGEHGRGTVVEAFVPFAQTGPQRA